MALPIHVVEPTLEDETGHCYSFVRAVCSSGPEQRFEVWAGKQARPDLFADLPHLQVRPHFHRRFRRPQAWLLYRRLLQDSHRVFLPTAGVTDIALLCHAASVRIRPGKVSCFVHWIRPSESRLKRLRAAAARQPDLGVLAPTQEIVAFLKEAGFTRARQVPYPLSPSARPSDQACDFRHALFAGAARMDKGFDRVVDLVELLAGRGEQLPIHLQTSARHYGKSDPEIRAQLERLNRIPYPELHPHPETLDHAAYFELFRGAICLQPYVQSEFAHRVSAVTVDALGCGAPVLTTADTWMGNSVERLGAGIAVKDPTGARLLEGLHRLIDDYPRYSIAARLAARKIASEHSPRHLLDAVIERILAP